MIFVFGVGDVEVRNTEQFWSAQTDMEVPIPHKRYRFCHCELVRAAATQYGEFYCMNHTHLKESQVEDGEPE